MNDDDRNGSGPGSDDGSGAGDSSRKDGNGSSGGAGEPRPRKRRAQRQQIRNAAARGVTKDILIAACRARPGDPLAQVAIYLDHASRRGIPAGTGKRRQVGEKRLTEIGNALKLGVASCREARTPIQNLTDLGQPHVIALVRLWNDKHHLAIGTIADRVSVLRRFFVMVGRPDVIPMGEAWREILRRHGIALPIRANMARLAKGWRDMGIEPYAVFEEMEAAGYWVVSSQSKMMLEWGLRRKESAMLRPHESDKDTYLLVSRGTKGGRTREVKLSAEPERRARQLAALQQAKALADKHPRGELALPGKELQTMLEHQRFVFEKFGIVGGGAALPLHRPLQGRIERHTPRPCELLRPSL